MFRAREVESCSQEGRANPDTAQLNLEPIPGTATPAVVLTNTTKYGGTWGRAKTLESTTKHNSPLSVVTPTDWSYRLGGAVQAGKRKSQGTQFAQRTVGHGQVSPVTKQLVWVASQP